jgi:4-hydroxy-3-methylbut-2-enyl diphosphate reductase
MRIVIDDNAGFCFGVVRAISTAEEELKRAGRLYCLGDIVHNNAEVSRLRAKGLEVIEDVGDVSDVANARVLIRAHGEPPSTYAKAKCAGVELIDATCPIVLALQQRIRKGYEEMCRQNGEVVIFGKPGHAEVVGLCGQTEGKAVVVSSAEDLEEMDFNRPIRLYSQTTKSREEYARLIENVKRRIAEKKGKEFAENGDFFVAYDTICSRVANRATKLEEFARGVDAVLFVSGQGSSNGHYLYEYCRRVQERTFLVYGPDEVKDVKARLEKEKVESVGITGATSTPRWLMEAVAQELLNED